MPIFEDPIEFVKFDLNLSIEGLDSIKGLVSATLEDHATYDLLKEYYKDEEEDMYWSEAQLDLIDMIGRENWLVKQI